MQIPNVEEQSVGRSDKLLLVLGSTVILGFRSRKRSMTKIIVASYTCTYVIWGGATTSTRGQGRSCCVNNWLSDCWLSPAQWFYVPSPTELMTIFYCLTVLEAFRVVIIPPNMGGPRVESEPGRPATWRFLAIFFSYCKRILACILQQAITFLQRYFHSMLTYAVDELTQFSWKRYDCSTSQEITRLLWNPKVH
jgi:hypothetical protein